MARFDSHFTSVLFMIQLLLGPQEDYSLKSLLKSEDENVHMKFGSIRT